jgi:hydroxypyruvate isomerase
MRYAVNCSILLTDLPLLERPAAARAAGFDAVEFWWPFPESVPTDREVDAFVRAIEDAGVALIGLNLAGGDLPAGERGLVSLPDRATEFRDSVPVAADIGRRLGCRAFNALYGNRIDGTTAEEQDELAASNLALAASIVDGTILIEPLSGAERYPLKTAADAVAVLDRVDAPNLALLADLYHLAVNGDDVEQAIARYADRIGHVQLADAPGRGEPGTGGLPLDRWLATIERSGYAGWIALEYRATTATPFGWLEETVS